jgi:hypothetical protein
MGVSELWNALKKESLVHSESFSSLLDRVQFAYFAVDVSHWAAHAQKQPKLRERYSPAACAAKIIFERSIQLLRLGCVPIIVNDNESVPASKAGYAGKRRNIKQLINSASSIATVRAHTAQPHRQALALLVS